MLVYLQYLAGRPLFRLRPLGSPQYVYRLDCPIMRETRYVGFTNNPKRRLRDHLGDKGPTDIPVNPSVVNHAKRDWIAWLLEQGTRPDMIILEEVNPAEDAPVRELRWFLHYLQSGARLTNNEARGRFLTSVVHASSYDFLNEPVGSLAWDDLLWATSQDKLYLPWHGRNHTGVQNLPPIEYRDMSTARKKGRLSIEAWTPTPEKSQDLWFAYRCAS